MNKKQWLTALAAPVMAFSLFQADEAHADTNFEMAGLTDTQLLIEQEIIKNHPKVHNQSYVTRQDVMKMLKRADEMKGLNPRDIFSLGASTQVDPKAPVTRLDMAKLFTLAMNDGKVPDVDLEVLNNFSDADQIPEDAKPYVAYAALAGGFDITFEQAFEPTEKMSLDEVAKAFKPLVFDVIDILSTNDIHGHITQNESYQQGGMAIIGGVVEDFRSVNDDGTVVLDGGDTMQGTLISNSFEGKSTIETLNDIGYDAGAIGNHEFDWGVDVLKQRLTDATYPILGANIFEDATNDRPDWAKPYTIVEKGGYKIGIIGFATPQTPQTTLSTHVEGLNFPTPAPIAKELAAELEAQGADIVMVTSHLPGWHEEESDKIMGELAELANASEGGLDALVGGHSHERVAGHVNGIPVVEAHRYTNAIGHIQLFVDRDTEEIYDSEVAMLETYDHLAGKDESVQEIVDYYKEQVEEVKSEVVSTTEGPITRDRKYGDLGVSQLGNMITDAMRERANADIAFQNSGGIRDNINAGDITYGEVFEVLPFDNYNVTAEMTAEQLHALLEGPAADDSNFMKIQFSGMNVTFDRSKADGERVTSIELTDGTSVYENGVYADGTFTVVTNNFLSTGKGDGYTTFGEVEWTSHPDYQRELFADYLRDKQANGETIVPSDLFDNRLIEQ
ncbi:multifunctional 2',3'-cyclic-nucleotide 2'-phosphodiesterase/5'-nucleotidase/3'-nucleotidase [Halobacillus fulvus]|nr:multifunctional 2',3'-cyclic-nucleotide 2'-phosphodiesterase/5'-nucleotidase/3'-nucleotidase [Halobacillus fulvus]